MARSNELGMLGFAGCAMVLVFLLFVGLAFIGDYLIAWLIVAVAGGFGYTWPFWPVFGGLFLFQFLLGGIASRAGK